MTRSLWDIEKEFERMRRQMNSLMSGFFNDSFDRNIPLISSSGKNELVDVSFKSPLTDIYETEREVIAKIEVPGIKKEDIKLEVKNGVLSVKAEQKHEKENKDEKKGYYRIERSYLGYSRSFTLPAQIDETKVKAKCNDGVLEVHMPKKKVTEKDGIKYIDIE